jgi:cellulose synthase/poly-beta-1,6-N-acetylglucosamine synthase-like glycosyltransferase
VRVSVALTRAGWRTRFVREAVAQNTVVDCWEDYWHQHIRWARNLFASAGTRRRAGCAPLRRRAEAWMVSTGYADRLVLLAALQLILAGRLRIRFAGLYLAVITAEVWAALAKARVGRGGPRFFLSTVALFALDMVASVTATGAHLLGRPRGWTQGRGSARVELPPTADWPRN